MPTILLIDDDPAILDVLVAMLDDHGYILLTATNGLAGLRCIQSNSAIDLILCDERMPILTGHELCQQLYADARFQAIPVVLLSAHAYEIVPRTPNCILFLRKPMTYPTLLAAVEYVLGAD